MYGAEYQQQNERVRSVIHVALCSAKKNEITVQSGTKSGTKSSAQVLLICDPTRLAAMKPALKFNEPSVGTEDRIALQAKAQPKCITSMDRDLTGLIMELAR